MTLTDALAIRDREVISLVGGGGKTALMFALGKELSSRLKGVILPSSHSSSCLVWPMRLDSPAARTIEEIIVSLSLTGPGGHPP